MSASEDHSVRMAAFRFLEEQTQLAGEDGALRLSSCSPEVVF